MPVSRVPKVFGIQQLFPSRSFRGRVSRCRASIRGCGADQRLRCEYEPAFVSRCRPAEPAPPRQHVLNRPYMRINASCRETRPDETWQKPNRQLPAVVPDGGGFDLPRAKTARHAFGISRTRSALGYVTAHVYGPAGILVAKVRRSSPWILTGRRTRVGRRTSKCVLIAAMTASR